MKITRLFACALLSLVMSVKAVPLSGTRSVGPTGDYTSITAAIADVRAQTLGGALVLELQPAYVGSVETFPIGFSNLTTTVANTLTLRPAAGAVALTISSAAAQTVDLNGAKFVTIDGRPGGVGSHAGSGGGAASQLTITNTATSGVALRFINEASSNTLRYTTLRGVNTSSSWGVLVFRDTSGPNGNDNNTVDHCDIRDGASTPANGIYSFGTTGTTAQFNSGNTISNCNVFNFYNATANTSNGLRLEDGNTDWTITGNSFYQTASRTGVAANVRTIYINSASGFTFGNNFTVTGNFIGGSAPNAGGMAWTTTGTTAAYLFKGIWLNAGTTAPSNVQGNTIANMVWTSSSADTVLPGVWSGIYVQAGSVNIGTVTGNTIGSGTGTGSVSVTTSGNGGTTFGICSGSGTVPIANNTIGSIMVNGTSTAISASLTGIQVAAGVSTISNNTVGSTTTANSLNAATSSTSATGQRVTGIVSSSSTRASITGNTVANLNNNYTATITSGQIRGIYTSTGVNTITGNTVRNLSTTSRNADTGAYDSAGQSVLGIAARSSAAGQTVSQNIVHSLSNTAASGNIYVTGIYYGGPDSNGGNIIARNLVHSLAISSTNQSSAIQGMEFGFGSFTAQNNMVRMGLDATGTSTAVSSIVRGIYDNSTSAGRNFYHNSVYLGGTQTSGISSTYAFISTDSANARTYQNNIFANARSSSGGGGKHYAVRYGGTGVNPTGLTAGGNLFLINGIGGVLGFYNGERDTLAAWQVATGQDATSALANPLFANPTGDASAVDLHLQTSNVAEGGGTALTDALTGGPATVTDDFDGQTRSSLTPGDVGADAGNFTLTPRDIFAPGISYPLLTSGSTANRVLTGWANIKDNSGTVSSGESAPRLYYRKSTDFGFFNVPNDSTGNGWKYVTATGSGPYSFTLDYSLTYGGSVSVGDTIQYFVVAQDAANNLGASPTGSAAASANPPVQNLNASGAVNTFSIVPAISGTKTVGSGGDYPSLTGAGGLFAALNASVVTDNVLVKISGDLAESGTNSVNEIRTNEFPAPAYTLAIQPDAATMRTISGASVGGLIRLNGADRVTIDGRFGGAGRYLTFRNSVGGDSTLLFINDASGNAVRNCIVEGKGSVILFSTGTVTGNNNNLITGCQVRDLSTAVGVPDFLINSADANLGNTISNNDLFNFSYSAVYIAATGGQSWTVSGNNIHEVKVTVTDVKGILMGGGGNNVISGNFIHDLLTTSSWSTGISFNGTGTTTIVGNRITAFNGNAATMTVYGISAAGVAGSTLHILNNQITLSPATSVSRSLLGINDEASTGSVVNVFYNSVVLGGTESGTRSSWASVRRNVSTTSTHTARNNLFLNLRTGGTGSHFAAGNGYTHGGYTVSHNVYAGTGATAAYFMDLSPSGSYAVNFATWQIYTGDSNSQTGLAGTGNFTTAMFVDAANGDLHLVPGGNVLVNALGTPIAGVGTDFDGDFRSAITPTIGADEFTLPSAFSTWAAANGVANDPNAPGANGMKNVLNFAFGISPITGGVGGLQYAGTFAGNGAITATGLPVTMLEGADLRALFVRRTDFTAAGLTYTPQFSADLSMWEASAAVPVVLADDGVNQIVSVPFPVLIEGNTASFFRLSVSLAP